MLSKVHHVVGIDCSINGTGVTVLQIEGNQIVGTRALTFTSVNKHVCETENVRILKMPDTFRNAMCKYEWTCEEITNFISNGRSDVSVNDYRIAFEGYAMHAKGRVFNIAEMTAWLKKDLFAIGMPFTSFEPQIIKMFATGKGNADKNAMDEAFRKLKLQWLPKDLTPGKSPCADLIDSYFIARMLYSAMLAGDKSTKFFKGLQKHEQAALLRKTTAWPQGYFINDNDVFIERVRL